MAHVTVRYEFPESEDYGRTYYELSGKYTVLENTIPLEARLGEAEAIAQSDRCQELLSIIGVEMVERGPENGLQTA